MSVSEEEVDEESGCGRDMAAAVSSDHAIYTPKPTYDQLDQYSPLSKRNEKEKQRRSGLATIAPKTGGGSSDSEEEEEETKKLIKLCSSPLRSRHILNRHPRCHSDPEVAPLSPPPSLDKEEEEEELPVKEIEKEDDNDEQDAEGAEEGEPEFPSTPESSPSSASVPPLFPPGEAGDDSTKLLPQVNVIPTTNSAPSTPTATTFDTNIPRSASAPWAPSEVLLDPDRPRSASWQGSSNVFPSLQDAHLRALGVSVQDSTNENLSAQEIENKFKQISLAIKTDRITLKQRLEVQQRQRDIAEANFDREMKQLESSILALHEDCINNELVDAIMMLRKHLDVLTISSASLLSASEVWGAVQQEWRVSKCLEVLLLHVENVRRMYENDHQELEEMRRLLNEHQIEYPATGGTSGTVQTTTTDSALGSIRIRALSLAGVSKQQSQESGNRRISLGPNASKNLRDFLGGRGSRRRASLMPDLGLFQQEIAAAAVAAAASNASSSSYLSKEKLEEKRHSTNGMLGNSITEEGSESGDEVSGNTRPATGDSSPTATSGTKITNFPLELYAQGMQDSDQRSNEEGSSSSFHTPASESHASSSLPTNFSPQPQHWAVLGFEDFIGWLRGGRWPFSSQQTYQGIRYLCTSFLLILAVLFLLLTISSGDEVQQPCHPGWTTIHHLLHPYVTIRHSGPKEF